MSNFDEKLIKENLSEDKWKEAFFKISQGYPVQYIIGNVEFYDNLIEVDESVLIPRFETEYLVDDLLKYIKESDFVKPRILDIGTGSGCIAIALKKNVDSLVDGLDISEKAIQVARKNAKNNNVNIEFYHQDICSFTPDNKYDVIISNPPYVAKDVKTDPKIKYEPQDAIFAEDNGLYFYKIILKKSISYLNKKNIIAFEIGHNQASEIKKLCLNYYHDAKIIEKNDLNGFNRYIYIIND